MTPFTLDKRDTKDPATLVLNKPQNKRRRLDKNPKHKLRSLPPAAPLSLSCRLARAASCLCLLSPVRSRSRRRSLALARRARCSTSSRTEKGASEQEPRAKIRARSLSLELPPALSPSRVLPLSCCLSHVRPLSCRRQAPMADGPDARERGGALLVLCRLTGLGAREVTLLPARTAIEMATTARAAAPILTAPAPSIAQQSVACPPSPSPSLSLSCAPRVPLPLSLVCPSAWHGRAWRMAKGRGDGDKLEERERTRHGSTATARG